MNNPSPLTQSHTQPPGAAAHPAEPRPNPAGRGAEPNVYIAHPTHGAGTRPNRTQPPTAARKTTLNAGQCVRQPREGRGRNRQPPPPKKKQGGGWGRARKQPTATKPPANTTRGGQTPHPEGTEDSTPKEAQRDHPAKTGNTKPGTAAHREKGHQNMQTHTTKQKKRASSPARKKRDGGTGATRPGTGTPSNRHHKAKRRQKKNKSAKNTPRQPSQEGRGTAETRAQHARPHRTPEPETAGGKRSAHATTHVPYAGQNLSPTTNTTNSRLKRDNTTNRAQTHPPKTPARTVGINKTHTQPQPGPKHKCRTTVGNPVPTARAPRQPVPCR